MSKNRGHIPSRSCISCGARRPKNDLFRLHVNTVGRLMIDLSGEAGGRGAYICKLDSCCERLTKNRHLNRLFRTDKVIEIENVLNGVFKE